MKKNFTFLFALFLMFVGTANAFANAYPFKITTDAENPELYAIKSGRDGSLWWTFDVTDNLISLTSYKYADNQSWYFMEVTEGETTYLQLYPYLGEGKAMGYKDTGAGAAKVWAVAPGSEGYDCRWTFDNNGGNAPYGLKTSDGKIYLSHYGGGANKMGMWTTGPAGDGGTAMYFEPVSKNAASLAKAVGLVDLFYLQANFGLVQDASKFSSNAVEPKEGSLANMLDNEYSTYFHSSWSQAISEKHYLQAEVSEPVESFVFYFKKRHNNNNNRPTDLTIFGSNDGANFEEITTINSGFPTTEDKIDYMSNVVTASKAYKFFRFVINVTNNNGLNNGFPFFTFSEFYMLPGTGVVENFCVAQDCVQDIFAAEKEGKASDALMADLDAFVDVYTANADNQFTGALVSAFRTLVNAHLADRGIEAAKASFDLMAELIASNDLFTVVTDEASLAANKRYILVAKGEEGTVAMSAQYNGSTPYRLQTKVDEAEGFVMAKCAVEASEELSYAIALESAGEGLWKLKDVVNDAYLHWTSKRSLELDEVGSTWEISIKENGEAVIKLAGKDRTLRYGDEDDRFACYAIGQNPVMLYEDAAANNFLVAYAKLGALAETCSSMWMIPAVNEKFMAVAETAMAMEPVAFILTDAELNGAIAEIEATIAYAWAMDAKYNEFKEQLYVCFDLQDNSTATEKVAAPFAAVVDKYIAYQWSVPATTTQNFDAYIAEMKAAAAVYAMGATAADGFSFDSLLLGIESEWAGAVLGKSITGYLYNPASKMYLASANSWGTQASFLKDGYKWTVVAEAMYDMEWLFDNAADIYAPAVGDVKLVPHKWVGNKQAPVAFEEGEETGVESTADGIFLPKTTSLFMQLNEAENLKTYSFVFDVKLADVQNYTSLYQTNLTNNDNDGELFIAKGMLGINGGGLGYGGTVVADQWHKIVVVVKDGIISTYLDGLHVRTATNVNNGSWTLDKNGVFFFLDNDGESTDVEVAGLQFWKKALTEVEVAQMSGVKTLKGEPVPARTAAWTFDNAENLFANSVGNIALTPCKVGENNTVPVAFEAGEDTGVAKTDDGIAMAKTTCLFMDLDEEADLANYTLIYDLKVADVNPYISMFQTNLENTEDGEIFINKGTIGVRRGGLDYSGSLAANKWYRIAFVVKDGIISLYLDGQFLKSSANADNNSWCINKDGVFLFLDNDGEHTAVEVGGIQFWKESLTAAQIKAVGAAFAQDAPTEVEVPAATAPTYILRGPLCHPSNPEQCHMGANGYVDQLPVGHVITRVGQSLYTIQYGGQYYAYKAGTTVLQKVNQLNEYCYWQFVTAEEFRAEYATATALEPANATFEIPGHNFGYNNTEVKEWTGSPTFGGEWANFIAYKENTLTCEMSTVLSNMPNGVYRMKVQGFYRQGTTPINSNVSEEERAAAVTARENGTEIVAAKFFANDATVPVMNILDCAGMNTTSTHGVVYGQYGKAPHGANDASVYFNLGLYEHTLVFEVKEGDNNTIKMGLIKTDGVANDWIVMDNYRLEYLGAKDEVNYMAGGMIASMTEGDKYVYYTDAEGKHHFLYAAGDADWVVVDEPTAIKFTNGNTTGFAKAASFMESNGRYMSNAQNGDGTGRINTQAVDGQLGLQQRTWESQVFYKNAEGKYAIRLTNSTGTSWGCHCFVDIDPSTLEVKSGNPSLGDALYLWTISEKAPVIDTAIEEVEVSEVATRAYYTLGGVPVDAPVKGVNIVKTTYTNGKVDIQKVYVK